MARISSRWTQSIAGSHLGAARRGARRGAEGARAERRSTFKLLLSYRGFIAPIIKAVLLPAFPSTSPLPDVYVTFCYSCEIWSLLILRGFHPHRPMSLTLALGYTRDYRAIWDFVAPRSCTIKGTVNVSNLRVLLLSSLSHHYVTLHGVTSP